MSTSGEGRGERRPSADRIVELSRPPSPAGGWCARTVYDDVRDLLTRRGWVRGRHAARGLLSLPAAVETAVGLDHTPAGEERGPKLARAARIRRHLCDLAGTASLVAWNDAPGRSLEDVVELLELSGFAHPDD